MVVYSGAKRGLTRRACVIAALLAPAAACRTPTTSSGLRDDAPGAPAAAAFLGQLPSEAAYRQLAFADPATNTVYVKLTVDYKAAGTPVYYQDTNRYPFHQPFLSANIPRFQNRTFSMDDILFGATKEVSGGALYYAKTVKIAALPAAGVLGFEIYFQPPEQVDVAEIAKVYQRLKDTAPFAASQLAYLFTDPALFFANKIKLDGQHIPCGRVSQVVGHGGP